MARRAWGAGVTADALIFLLESHSLAEVAAHIGQPLAATRLLLGHLTNEGRVIPDGRGGYTLHPRERAKQEAAAKVVADYKRSNALPGGDGAFVRTLPTPDVNAQTPKRIAHLSEEDWFGKHD